MHHAAPYRDEPVLYQEELNPTRDHHRGRTLTDEDIDALVERMDERHPCRLDLSNEDVVWLKDWIDAMKSTRSWSFKMLAVAVVAFISGVVWLFVVHGIWKNAWK